MSALSVALAAVAACLLAAGGAALAGRLGAALAPALFWLAPRHVELLFAGRLDLEAAWLLGGRGGGAGPSGLRLAALTVPAAAGAAMAAGVLHSAGLVALALRRRDRATLRLEVPLLAASLLLLGAAAWRGSPRGVPGALPLLLPAILGARAMAWAARALWPERRAAVAASLALVTLAPGLRAVVHSWPHGFASWNELAGGAPGAASRGLPSPAGGDPTAAILASLGAHAVGGARVWWGETPRPAVEAWQRERRARADLRWADRPEDADVALWRLRADDRDREYRIWSAFGSARPVDGVFLDEVPLLLAYARPGAWR